MWERGIGPERGLCLLVGDGAEELFERLREIFEQIDVHFAGGFDAE